LNEDLMLAYVFWHAPNPGADICLYEQRLSGFHAAMTAHPPPAYHGSAVFAIRGAPWMQPPEGYEDWYLVDDFAALGLLNEAAVSGARKQPHDEAAMKAGWGAGGVYKLIQGAGELAAVRHATWFGKPAGISYQDFYAQVGQLPENACLWQRQMVLGPASEFCLHSAEPLPIPTALGAVGFGLRRL